MTDRVHSLTIILEAPRRVDDVDAIVAAVSQLRGVERVIVTPENIADFTSAVALTQARKTLRAQLADVLWPKAEDR